MDFSSFKNLAEHYNAIPVSRRLLADVMTPVSVFLSLRENSQYPFLLESVEGGEHLARYSFLGKNPYKVLTFDGKSVSLVFGDCNEKLDQPYFEILRDLTTAYREPDLPDLPRLTGGAVGFSSYDTVRQVESLLNTPPEDVPLPEAVWAFYDEIIAFDHVKKQLVLMKTVFIEPGMDMETAYDDAIAALDRLEKTVQKVSAASQ
jgi:anthranilate synthase component I